MKRGMKSFTSVEAYLDAQPASIQGKLQELRTLIQQAAPAAEECISYQMPAYKLQGALVYFAGCKNHIGFYPTSSVTKVFKKELAAYKTSKGAIQFPLEKPIPKSLVKTIVKFRVNENLLKAAAKKVKTKPLKKK